MKTGRAADALDWLRPGMNVFIQGATGEPGAFIETLSADPERANGVTFWSCLVPGINNFDYGSLPGDAQLVTFMASPALEPSITSGRTRVVAMPYSSIAVELARTSFDLAILQAAPPRLGLCSFGVSCDVPAIVLPRAAKRIVYLNAQMPRLSLADVMRDDEIDLAIEVDYPLANVAAATPTPDLAKIGRLAANLVPDGVAIQSGIGQAPGAVIAELIGRRGLRIRSGIITPEYRTLAEAGALDLNADHLSGIAFGDAGLYDWLGEADLIRFGSIFETHGRAGLAATPRFTSINSALEVDLGGQLNLEWLGSRRVSSIGGAPDYMGGAAASPGGRSIVVLPSTARNGMSRIVARLERPSLTGELTDTIVTEHGVAELKGKSPQARAEALIAIAAPQHRAKLAADWADVAKRPLL